MTATEKDILNRNALPLPIDLAEMYPNDLLNAGYAAKRAMPVVSTGKAGAAISWNYEAHFNCTYPVASKGTCNFNQKLPAELVDILSMFFYISGHGYDW